MEEFTTSQLSLLTLLISVLSGRAHDGLMLRINGYLIFNNFFPATICEDLGSRTPEVITDIGSFGREMQHFR